MINSIIQFSINNKLVIALFTIAIIIAGTYSITRVPIDAVPDITNNQVAVLTQAPNLGTEEIEQFVSYPVEMAMANLPGVVEIRSISRFGLSAVTIVFEDDMGTYLPRQLVAEKLDQLREDIPENFGSPYMGPITTGLGEIYQFALEVDSAYKDRYTLYDLRTMQDWIISRQMAMVPGVIEVNAFGGLVKQYEVALNPHLLNSMNISVQEVYQALKNNNANTGGAYLEYDYRANFIRGEGMAKSLEDINNIVVKTVDGSPVMIKNIAEVGYGNSVRYGAFTRGGEGETVGGIIMMLKGSNSKEVIRQVKERMQEIEKSLPEGVTIKAFLDRSELISGTTGTVIENLTVGALIVIFVLVFLLGNWRGGLIVASTIPLSLLIAFILMDAFDVWANLMSLGAIDFGIIVDGAVIIVEGTVSMLYQKVLKKETVDSRVRDETASAASKKMMNAAFFGQLVILIVFLPILALEGIEGKMFQPMALTFMFAMIGVIILCLTYVPMMSAWFLRPGSPKQSWGDQVVKWLEEKYARTLEGALKFRVFIILSSLVLFGAALFTYSRLGGEFIPRLDEGDIAFHDILKPGSSLSESIKITTRVEQLLLEEFPEAEQVLSRIGVTDVPTDLMPMDLADCFIILKPKSEWVTADSKEELIDKIKERLRQIPGVNYEFTQPIEMRFNELMTGVRQDVAIKIFGEDLEVLASKANEVADLVKDLEGVADLRVEATRGQPQISIQYDRNKLAYYGVDISTLNMLVKTAFSGSKAGVIFEGERRYDVVMRLQEQFRNELEDVQKLLVSLPNGNQVPLKEVADVAYQQGPMQISRDNTSRRAYVGINVRGRDIQSLIEEVANILDEELELPPGYYIRYGGAFENFQNATRRLQLVVPIALGLIFLLIFLALRSFRQTLIIYMAIPLAAIGGIFSLWLRGMPFSISAGIGFIVLFGIAVLNGLLLINSWNELKTDEKMSLKERITLGARRRIRPILLTASTDILGFLPMALSGSAGAEVQRPLATVVIGGMITATLMTLFILPILYRWTERHPFSFNKTGIALLVIGVISVLQPAGAQSINQNLQSRPQLSLDLAVSLALERYPVLQALAMEIEKQEKLKKTRLNLGRTGLFTAGEEVGGENSGVVTPIGIQQQNIDLFSSGAKGKVIEAQQNQAKAKLELATIELIYQVKRDYMKAYLAGRKYQLLTSIDSVYQALESALKLKSSMAASSELEYLSAANQAREMTIQKDQAAYDYQIGLENLHQWLVTDTVYEVQGDPDVWTRPLFWSDSLLAAHPLLKTAQTRVALKKAQSKAVSAGYWPTINASYGIQTIDGQGGFYQYQLGLYFPLIFNTQKGKVQAARLDQEIARRQLKKTNIELQNEFAVSKARYEKWQSSWEYFREEAIPLAEKQLEGSLLAYQEGEIDYVTFLLHSHQALKMELRGLETLGSYLQSKIYLMYLIQQP